MAAMATEDEHLLIVGTYSENLGFVDGKGKGLYAFRLTVRAFVRRRSSTSPLLGNDVVGANPTYLCKSVKHDDVVYVVDESNLERGARVRAIKVDKDACTAQPLGDSLATGDSSACHVAATETHVYVANYCGGKEGTGSCAAFHVGEDGSLKSDASEADLLQDACSLRRLSALGSSWYRSMATPSGRRNPTRTWRLSVQWYFISTRFDGDVVWRLNTPT